MGILLKLMVMFSAASRSVKGLVGRVAWVEKERRGRRYAVGVDLIESPPSALLEWQKLVAEKTSGTGPKQ